MESDLVKILSQLLKLFFIDSFFLILLSLAVMIPLAIFKRASYAVLKRNFIGYFSNPTGYVFLCLFVILTSIGAFFPHAFFINNMANLEPLNKWIPYIMLVFIPAITMSIWAEEKRQGTDELLLTLPAGDFDIVFGKYLAAAAIFTVSLIFSQIASYAVLVSLTRGNVDAGLLFTTYLGYWFVGLAMLALGMVASFLTNNLTVGFIFGVLFNAPLAFADMADVIISKTSQASAISRWSAASQFDDFGRGVISFASCAYFIMIAIAGIYLSMVFIGSRHWFGGRDGQSMFGHYFARALSLGAIIVGATIFLSNYDFLRFDLTAGKVSSLSPQTRNLVRTLEKKYPIVIDAYLSNNLPEQYAKTRYDLLALLKEFKSLAGTGIQVNINDGIARASDEARDAKQIYNITPRTVPVSERGSSKQEQVILGVGFTCGPEKVTVPFIDFGVAVEYELVRSLMTVSKGDRKTRKKIGVVATDAQMMGGVSMANMMQPQQFPEQLIIAELRKQYAVDAVDLNEPIATDKFDMLLVVQPSTLGPQQMGNLVAAVRSGIPSAIFEDPLPWAMPNVSGTGDSRRGGGFGGQQPQGDIKLLWKALGIKPLGGEGAGMGGRPKTDLIWQEYNPYPRFQDMGMGPEFVFIRANQPHSADAKPAYTATETAVNTLEEVLFAFPGAIVQDEDNPTLEFTELLRTSDLVAGRCDTQEFRNATSLEEQAEKRGSHSGKSYVLAARIRGKQEESTTAEKNSEKSEEKSESEAEPETKKPLNVIYVADVDVLDRVFVELRERPKAEMFGDMRFNFDNIPFVLNIVDDLLGDDRFLAIRTRKFSHSTLQAVEQQTENARSKLLDLVKDARKKLNDKIKEEDEGIATVDKKFSDMEQKIVEKEPIDYAALSALKQQRALEMESRQRKSNTAKEAVQNEINGEIESLELDHERRVLEIQNRFKTWALALPPIPPLLLGLLVFARRRMMEREGISKTRMR
jgi:ABC-2 type transport system permease protein